jgi:hypothetical protein
MNKLANEEKIVKNLNEKSLCFKECKHLENDCPILNNLISFNKKFNVNTIIWECETYLK